MNAPRELLRFLPVDLRNCLSGWWATLVQRYVLVKVPSITARVTQEQRKILFEEFKSRG